MLEKIIGRKRFGLSDSLFFILDKLQCLSGCHLVVAEWMTLQGRCKKKKYGSEGHEMHKL